VPNGTVIVGLGTGAADRPIGVLFLELLGADKAGNRGAGHHGASNGNVGSADIVD